MRGWRPQGREGSSPFFRTKIQRPGVIRAFSVSDNSRESGIFSIPYEFEFNPAKSASNLATHGIDFVSAQRLWQDSDRFEVSARSTNEPRQQVIGRVGSVIWSAFVAPRGGRVRIISVRRARYGEKDLYIDRQGDLGA